MDTTFDPREYMSGSNTRKHATVIIQRQNMNARNSVSNAYVRWFASCRLSGASTQRATNEPTSSPVKKHDAVRAIASIAQFVADVEGRLWIMSLGSQAMDCGVLGCSAGRG